MGAMTRWVLCVVVFCASAGLSRGEETRDAPEESQASETSTENAKLPHIYIDPKRQYIDLEATVVARTAS